MTTRSIRRLLQGALTLSLSFALLAPSSLAQSGPHPDTGNRRRGAQMQDKKPEGPTLPPCDCYWSGDCAGGATCYWGPQGPFTEDHCNWMLPKPNGVVGGGCNGETDLPGGCDGVCSSALSGSIPGTEDPVLVALAVDLWALSFLDPAARGGGPVDPEIGEAVFALPFRSPHTAEILGRMVGSLFVLAGGQDFFHPDPQLGIPEGHCAPGILLHHVADLSKTPWRLDAQRLLVAALQAEMAGDFAASNNALERTRHCIPDEIGVGNAFLPVCGAEATIECVRGRVRDLGISLVTPRTNYKAPVGPQKD